MNRDRRIVVSVALGLSLAVIAYALTRSTVSDGGWFTYEPASGRALTSPDGSPELADTLISLVAVALWATASWFLFDHEAE